MAIDLNELRAAIRDMLSKPHYRTTPLWKLLKTELAEFWRSKPRGKDAKE